MKEAGETPSSKIAPYPASFHFGPALTVATESVPLAAAEVVANHLVNKKLKGKILIRIGDQP